MGSSFNRWWRGARPLRRTLLIGVPIVALALGSAACGSGKSKAAPSSTEEPSATSSPRPTSTPVPPTPVPTEAPVSAGLQSTGGGSSAAASTGGGDGGGGTTYVPDRTLSGPGAAQATGWSLSVPAIGVNASVYSRSIGENGQMGNPSGAYDVVWYDFAGWDGLGGAPGTPGANAVFAGHVDYIHVGPAVFWSIRNLAPGDTVTVYANGQAFNYSIQWSQWAAPDEDFTNFVAQTGQESITLVTCIGGFSAGHYSNRLIVRGVRI